MHESHGSAVAVAPMAVAVAPMAFTVGCSAAELLLVHLAQWQAHLNE